MKKLISVLIGLGSVCGLMADEVLLQVNYQSAEWSFDVVKIYQTGSQIFIQISDKNIGGGIQEPGYRMQVYDFDLPSVAAIITRDGPTDQSRILYDGEVKMNEYALDKGDPWVFSNEFGKSIYLAHYPWIFVPDEGYVYLYDSVFPDVDNGGYSATPTYPSRWIYKKSLGHLYFTGLPTVLPPSSNSN